MAKIYISYSRNDKAFVMSVAEQLRRFDNEILIDDELLQPGLDWRTALNQGMRESDVFLTFLSTTSSKSPFVLGEIGAARAYAEQSKNLLFIPVVIDQMPIPAVVQDLFVFVEPERNIANLVGLIQGAVTKFIAQRETDLKRADDASQRLEINAHVYIEEAIDSLRHQEARNRWIGNTWYVCGFVALVAGAVFGVVGLLHAGEIKDRQWVDFAIISLKTVVVLSLLGACAKYSFSLGRSYISEALKGSDRIHAISFGKFYLKAFGSNADWPQLKEVFQHWNIDRTTAVPQADVSQFDPQIFEKLLQFSKEATKILGGAKQ